MELALLSTVGVPTDPKKKAQIVPTKLRATHVDDALQPSIQVCLVVNDVCVVVEPLTAVAG